jgi:cell division protein FtsB
MKTRSFPRGRGDFARAVLIIVAGIMVGLFVGNLIGKLSRPYRQLWRQRSELRELTQQVQAERRERARLRDDVARMNTPEGMLLEARRRGYLRPGEHMLRYVEPENWPRARSRETPPTRLSRLKQRMLRVLEGMRSRGKEEPPSPQPSG